MGNSDPSVSPLAWPTRAAHSGPSRTGPRSQDPDLIIRMPDGYHGAIAASLTDYAGITEPNAGAAEPPLLSIEGLWRIAQFVEQQQRLHPQRGDQQI